MAMIKKQIAPFVNSISCVPALPHGMFTGQMTVVRTGKTSLLNSRVLIRMDDVKGQPIFICETRSRDLLSNWQANDADRRAYCELNGDSFAAIKRARALARKIAQDSERKADVTGLHKKAARLGYALVKTAPPGSKGRPQK